MATSKKLVWHTSGANRYELGVSDCALYIKKDTVADGAVTEYNEGIAWNGITSIQETADGADANDLWADNIKYGTLRSAETLGGTIEAYQYPDEFADCDGTYSPIAGFRIGQQKRKNFGIVYKTKVGNETQTESDDGYKLHIIYNCTASPSDRQYESINDSPDAITFSWEFDTIPVDFDPTGTYKPISSITINTIELTNGVKNANLLALEEALFGGTKAAYLPTPEVVLGIMKGTHNADGSKKTA